MTYIGNSEAGIYYNDPDIFILSHSSSENMPHLFLEPLPISNC